MTTRSSGIKKKQGPTLHLCQNLNFHLKLKTLWVPARPFFSPLLTPIYLVLISVYPILCPLFHFVLFCQLCSVSKTSDLNLIKVFRCPALLVTPWTIALQGPLSTGFSRQECWSALLFPCPRDLPHPRIESKSRKNSYVLKSLLTILHSILKHFISSFCPHPSILGLLLWLSW